ncbi:MAG: ferredoxin [Nitrospiraceae bacterium]|nr:ferredoxin [Nitrospiraceae bacterium]MDA8324943.1 ferredoxin [Nitrospiraceae bacterium]
MMMIPKIDPDKCIGCGNCEEVCPAVFHLNEQLGKAEVMDPEGCEFAGCCEAAAENCPEEAISLEEGE